MSALPNKNPDRIGDWIQTFTGRSFWPLDPREEDVCIEDIAHALALRCRFAGHCIRFYSVAEHSVLISYAVPKSDALWGLLHDAAEAYSSDLPKPLKRSLPQWQPLEQAIMSVISSRFGMTSVEPESVKKADYAILRDEQIALMAPCARDWGYTSQPLGVDIQGWSPEVAESRFYRRFLELIS